MSIVIRRARPGDHLLIRELQQEIAALHYEGRPDLFQKEGLLILQLASLLLEHHQMG